MPATPTLFFRGSASTTSANLYTVPSGKSAVLTDIVVSNVSSSQQYVTITVDSVNIIPTVPIAPNTVITIQPKTVIGASKIVAGLATSTDVKFHISGVEIT